MEVNSEIKRRLEYLSNLPLDWFEIKFKLGQEVMSMKTYRTRQIMEEKKVD